jgi:hypothetical protein
LTCGADCFGRDEEYLYREIKGQAKKRSTVSSSSIATAEASGGPSSHCHSDGIVGRLGSVTVRMHEGEIEVDDELVRSLLGRQMPSIAHLPLVIVQPWGTDNAIWRLGSEFVVRLPRIHWAAGQVELEALWLPRLAPHLPVAIPEPFAMGKPSNDYPYRWAVHRCDPR